MLGHAVLNGVFVMPAIAEVHALHDGDILDVPGRPHVLHMPGHTPGEVAFFLPDARILLSGDTLITRHLLTGIDGPPQVPPSALSDEYETAHRSLDRVRDLGDLVMLAGHGKAWRGNMRDAVMIVQQSKVDAR
jgi:glyoxylase-like metal-dependent hydrolase (beta-lactamase superfamily II)